MGLIGTTNELKWLDRLIRSNMDFQEWSKDLWKWFSRIVIFTILKKKWFLNPDNSPRNSFINNWLFKVKYSEAKLRSGNIKSYRKPIITEEWVSYFSRFKLLNWKSEIEKRNELCRSMPNWKKLPWSKPGLVNQIK